jgi:hypothetical protein
MIHIEEDAELYALGLLDPQERERIDDHVASCDTCAGRLGEAEGAVAALIDTSMSRAARRPRRWQSLAVNAGLGLGFAASLVAAIGFHRALDADGTVMAWFATSHFAHAQFQTPSGKALDVKAVYERHGHWYAIVANGTPSWHAIVIEPDGTRRVLPQTFANRGAASVLTIPDPPPTRAIELDDAAGNVVGTVHPLLVTKPTSGVIP